MPRDSFSCIALNYSGNLAAYGTSGITAMTINKERLIKKQTGKITAWNPKGPFESGKRYWPVDVMEVTDLSFNRDGTRIASIGTDRFIRLWDSTTALQICCIAESKPTSSTKSADGDFIILTNIYGVTKIWKIETLELVFHKSYSTTFSEGLSEHEASMALRNSGLKSGRMWPRSPARVSGDVFAKRGTVYCMEGNEICRNVFQEKVLADIAGLRFSDHKLEFNCVQGTFATVEQGCLIVCRLVK